MHDVSQGEERFRAWARKRGPAKTTAERDRQRKFAGAQLATKFISPTQFADWMAAVEGTALLPRDMMTAMFYQRLLAFVMDDGKVIWPMAARQDTSEALDTISQTEGDLLIRGATGWEAISKTQLLSGGPEFTEIALLAPTVFSGTAAHVIPFDTPISDPSNWYDITTKRFQPTREGLYVITGQLQATGQTIFYLAIYKNGANWRTMSNDNGQGELAVHGACIVYMNGTTDYLQVRAIAGTGGLNEGQTKCYMQALGPL